MKTSVANCVLRRDTDRDEPKFSRRKILGIRSRWEELRNPMVVGSPKLGPQRRFLFPDL
jgi:hypothetical protein